MLHARAVLDRVAHVLQFENKTIKAVGGYNGLFHILANHAAYGGLAGLTAYPLGVGFPLAVCFDYGQAVLAAKFVGDFSDTFIIGIKVTTEHFPILIGHRIYNYVIV